VIIFDKLKEYVGFLTSPNRLISIMLSNKILMSLSEGGFGGGFTVLLWLGELLNVDAPLLSVHLDNLTLLTLELAC
jgi:hypothetical protein